MLSLAHSVMYAYIYHIISCNLFAVTLYSTVVEIFRDDYLYVLSSGF